MSSNGRCFDIGNTVRNALDAYLETKNPFSGPVGPTSAGNGSIMRLAPVPIYWQSAPDDAEHWAGESSRTTHGAVECIEACRILARILIAALSGADKDTVLSAGRLARDVSSAKLRGIVNRGYLSKHAHEIRGTGYVVASLEAALWSFATTDTYRDAVLTAANLGDDADTTAAICGQVAGAYYGMQGIPQHWLDKLVMRETIEALAVRLCAK
jgi:ADP-ribosyl-[dinitrogen reductase] hydrolase